VTDDPRFDRELARRLDLIESPDYRDPALADLPIPDLVGLAILVVVTVAFAYWMLY
jgi:hypothetical protein